MREQFEKAEDEESKKKGKGKARAPESPPSPVSVDRKGKGVALVIRHKDGHEVDDAGLGSGGGAELHPNPDIASDDEDVPATQWEDSAEKDDEDLYGGGDA